MQFETPRQHYWSENKRSLALLYAAGALLALAFAYVLARAGIDPLWIAIAIPALAILPIVVRRYPVALMVALVYVGMFKPHRALGISLTDPTLLTLALLMIALAFEVLLVSTGEQRPGLAELFAGQTWGVASFLLLILIIAVSYTYTPAPVIGSEKTLPLLVFDVPIFLAPLFFLRTERDVHDLVVFNLVVALALGVLTAYRVAHPTAEELMGVEDPTKISAGLAQGMAVLTILYFPLATRRRWRFLLLACAGALTVGVVASVSRSAILSLVIVGGASALFLRAERGAFSRKSILVTLGLVVLAIAISAFWMESLPGMHSKFVEKTDELGLMLQGGGATGTAGERYSFDLSAWHAFLEKPFVGWGVGGWSTLWHFTDGRIVTYPHDFILEIASEQGLVGLAALGLLMLALVKACAKVVQARWVPFVFIVPVVAMNVLGNSVTGQVDDRGMWFWCGTLFALARLSSSQQPSDNYGQELQDSRFRSWQSV